MAHLNRKRAAPSSVVRGRVARASGLLAVTLVAALGLAPGRASASATSSFGIDLYRPGVYAMQATWTWCTAASVEIMRNEVLDATDHSAADQARFFTYMHARDRYPAIDPGVDPLGFLAGLRAFVDPAYRLVASTTFAAAVRSAARQLRLTNDPVALLVDAGRHAWVLVGFNSTADPASSPAFEVTSVRIVGPLYGRQSSNGYDPPPDTRLSYAALRRFLLPYTFPYGRTPWDGRFITFQSAGSAWVSSLATTRRS